MLRGQYGTATPSSYAPVTHAEDAQPNEGINKRTSYLPPAIRNTARSEATSIHYRGSRGRGGYRGNNVNHRERGRPLIQYAIRGNSSWRGRGRGFHVYPDRTPNTADIYSSSSSTSSSGSNPTPREHPAHTDPSYSARRRIQELRNQSSSQTSATPPPPVQGPESLSWMFRSKSPTPKLPPDPITRRKFEEQAPLPPPKPSQMPSSSTSSKLPLPGRMRKASEPVKKQATPPAPPIKREIISPPPLSPKPERKLVTSACEYYAFPDNCRKSDPNYQTNRRTFVLDKNRSLIRMGLKREKAFVREDGLVIEWSSPLPVWSDTLLPETMDLATAIRQTYQVNCNNPSPSASSQRSQSSSGPSSSQSKISHRISPRPMKTTPSYPATNLHPSPKKIMKRSPEGSSSLPSKRARPSATPNAAKANIPLQITPSPTPKIQPDSKTRLPLPGRRSLNSMPPPVPFAFLPRPTSMTPSHSTLMNLKKHNNFATGRKLSISDCSSQRTTTSPRPSPSPMNNNYPSDTDFHHIDTPMDVHPSSTLENDNSKYPMWHPPETPNLSDENDFNSTLRSNDDDLKMVDSDYLDAEDVASSLLTRTCDNARSDDENENENEIEIDVDASASGSTDDDGTSEEVEALVSDYLLRFCQLFDSDRSKLENAYDKNALFSCRVHHQEEPSYSMAGLFAPEVEHSFRSTHSRATASTVHQGRAQIVNKLLSLGPYQFCPRGVTCQLSYDTVDVDSATGVLLTVHGEVVNPHMSNPDLDHVLTLDQSFVLRRTSTITDAQAQAQEEEGVNNNNNGLGKTTPHVWPLVAVSHQMTVRAMPFLSPEKLEEALPWIRETFLP